MSCSDCDDIAVDESEVSAEVAALGALSKRVISLRINFLMLSLLGIVNTSVAVWRAVLLCKYCRTAACTFRRCCILDPSTSASVLANSEFCFWSSTRQNCNAESPLNRLVSRLHSAATASFNGSRHETISLMTQKSPSLIIDACPGSISAFWTGPRNKPAILIASATGHAQPAGCSWTAAGDHATV